MIDKEPISKKESDKIVEEALDFYTSASDSESAIRKDMLDDLEFLYGDQWPQDIQTQRTMDKRPCLTVNQLPQFVRQVTNDQRHNRPAITVSPIDDGADQETAEILTGLMRHIQTVSDADVAIDTAFFSAASIGLGYMRVTTDYEAYNSFNQDIYIKRILNPFSVYFGMQSSEHDYSDATQCMIVDDIPVAEFKRLYPKAEVVSADQLGSTGNNKVDWAASDESIRIGEYFKKCFKDDELILLSTGEQVLKSEIEDVPLPMGITIEGSRKTQVPYIEWYLITGNEVLEKKTWPGIYIPVIPVIGEEFDINGERKLKGIVRDAKDSQRMYNFWATAQTEMIALAPKAPWIGVEGQFEGYEKDWERANQDNLAYLEYKAVDIRGNPAPSPQRNAYEAPIQAISASRSQAAYDLKAVTGIYGASLGEASNERSGKAILARQREGDMTNYHYIDNLSRSIRYLGKVILDLIPHIYDVERTVRIVNENGEEDMVKLNAETEHKGMQQVFDPSVGRYDVVVTAGPSYSTKRQEAMESMMSLTNSYPEMAQIAGDLIVKNMDWPGAKEISERLKRAIPPQLLGDDAEQGGAQQMQQQMQQMGQELEQLNAHAQQVEQQAGQMQQQLDAIGQENAGLKLQLKDKSEQNQIEVMKIQTDKELKERELDIKEADVLIKAHDTQAKVEDIKLKPHARIMDHQLNTEHKMMDMHMKNKQKAESESYSEGE